MRKTGMTLIELTIALGILLIVISLIFSVTGTGRISWATASTQLYLSSQARQASAIISQELILSQYATEVFLTTDQNSNSILRFNIPLSDGSEVLQRTATGDLIWGDGTTQGYAIQYYVDSSANLIRRVLEEDLTTEVNSRIVAHNVSNFTVVNPANSRQYDITVVFSINSYLGTRLPEVMTDSLTFSVTPMN